MGDPIRKLERARRDARRFAADARRLAARHRRRLGKKLRAEIVAASAEVEKAATEGAPERLSDALRALDALWDEHLATLGKPAWRAYGEVVVAAVLVALAIRAFAFEGFRIPSGSMAPTLVAGDHVLVSKLAYGVRVPFTSLRILGRGEPRRGDVVVFESPTTPGVDVVKRVVGIPGDVVELREETLYVNGIPQPRSAAGEVAYEERGERGAPPQVETCRRFRETLAKGALAAEPDGDAGTVEAAWQAGASAGVASYDVLQCGRGRLAAREGPFPEVAPGHVFVVGDNRDRSADSRGVGGWQVPLDRIAGKALVVYFSWGNGGALSSRFGAGPRLDRLFKAVE
jgi:signal peptidase I